jgi:hypothetical protein
MRIKGLAVSHLAAELVSAPNVGEIITTGGASI